MNSKAFIFGILIVIFIFTFIKIYFNEKKNYQYKISVKQIVRVGIFGALSAVFYLLIKFPVPFLPTFLEFHFDDVPSLIASFAYGPITGLFVIFVKFIITLPFTHTLAVGEISDLIYSIVLIIPAAILYEKRRNFKTVIVGLLIGCVLELAISLLVNIFIMIPFYINLMGFSEEGIIEMCKAANSNISDLKWSYGLIAVLPFNLIKNAVVILLTILTYKATRRFIEKLQK